MPTRSYPYNNYPYQDYPYRDYPHLQLTPASPQHVKNRPATTNPIIAILILGWSLLRLLFSMLFLCLRALIGLIAWLAK
jgi:hypothetical protein